MSSSQAGAELYANICPTPDKRWVAFVVLPGAGAVSVGQHALQVVAACMADKAALTLYQAGVQITLRLNVDTAIKGMVSCLTACWVCPYPIC
jgi:hypothetical protein